MHNIHINDAIEAYQKIDRINVPDYAKPFDLAMVNFTVKKINGQMRRKIIRLTGDEYDSFISILKNA